MLWTYLDHENVVYFDLVDCPQMFPSITVHRHLHTFFTLVPHVLLLCYSALLCSPPIHHPVLPPPPPPPPPAPPELGSGSGLVDFLSFGSE